MRNVIAATSVVLVAALAIWAGVSLERWKFHECRKVGHSTAYCIFVNAGER